MNAVYRKVRHIAANIVRGLHPRAIAWRIRYASAPSRSIITKLGEEGRLKVRVHPHDVIGKVIYRHRVFEKPEARLVTNFLRPGMVFFDVGANLGQYTLLGADRVGDAGQVHSFEPSPRMFGELSFNVALNGLNARCTLNNLALSDHRGSAKLSRYEAGSDGYSSLGKNAYPGNTILGYDDVTTTTLDSYTSLHSISHVDLIKMDIEGAELLALRGAGSILRGQDAPAIVIEMADVTTAGFDYSAVEIWDYLESFGYQWFAFGRSALLTKAIRPCSFQPHQNLLAVKCHFDRWRFIPGSRLVG